MNFMSTMLIFQLSVLTSECCPIPCKCYEEITKKKIEFVGKCNGRDKKRQLYYIPKFPPNTSKIIFIYNNIPHLSKDMLINITSIPVSSLSLAYNKIRGIENDTFKDLKKLKTLDMSGNKGIGKKSLVQSFYFLPGLLKLCLNNLNLSPFQGMFDGLINGSIQIIELRKNKLPPFDGRWFEKLSGLIELDIANNNITSIDLTFRGLENLQCLDLRSNLITEVPQFCEEGIQNLRELYLSDNYLYSISEVRTRFKCLKNLYILHLSGLPLQMIPDNVFSELHKLHQLKMINMGPRLKTIFPYAFNSSSLESLSFSRAGRFRFSLKMSRLGAFKPRKLLKECPNLKLLDLSGNIIVFSDLEIRKMFSNLKKLRTLRLNNLGLTYIPTDFFKRFPKLEKLFLEDNRITPWKDGSVFNGLLKLKELHLKNNKINMVRETSFPANIFNTLTLLDLANNTFTCSCDLMWFRNWIKHQSNVEIKYVNTYKCDNRDLVIHYNPTPDECRNVIMIVVITTGSLLGMIVVATILVYLCRWRIRFKLYSIRSFRQKYQRLGNDDFVYAAYIIYCYEDFSWVKNNLIPKLEDEQGFKLCIPERDFDLGKVFADNIVEHMDCSKTVIPVLSNNFSKNEWCLFQLAVARNKLTREGKMSIFPVILEELKFKNMNSALYSLIRLSSYAAWNQDENALELFWNQVQDHINQI